MQFAGVSPCWTRHCRRRLQRCRQGSFERAARGAQHQAGCGLSAGASAGGAHRRGTDRARSAVQDHADRGASVPPCRAHLGAGGRVAVRVARPGAGAGRCADAAAAWERCVTWLPQALPSCTVGSKRASRRLLCHGRRAWSSTDTTGCRTSGRAGTCVARRICRRTACLRPVPSSTLRSSVRRVGWGMNPLALALPIFNPAR